MSPKKASCKLFPKMKLYKDNEVDPKTLKDAIVYLDITWILEVTYQPIEIQNLNAIRVLPVKGSNKVV